MSSKQYGFIIQCQRQGIQRHALMCLAVSELVQHTKAHGSIRKKNYFSCSVVVRLLTPILYHSSFRRTPKVKARLRYVEGLNRPTVVCGQVCGLEQVAKLQTHHCLLFSPEMFLLSCENFQ